MFIQLPLRENLYQMKEGPLCGHFWRIKSLATAYEGRFVLNEKGGLWEHLEELIGEEILCIQLSWREYLY